jgi:hypothetical protein
MPNLSMVYMHVTPEPRLFFHTQSRINIKIRRLRKFFFMLNIMQKIRMHSKNCRDARYRS